MQSVDYPAVVVAQEKRKRQVERGGLHVEQHGDTAVVRLQERMDVFSAPLLMHEFGQLMLDGARHFIIDLSPVRSVDADGDYPLLHLLKCAQEAGGSVTLICPPGNPIRVFYEIMRLDTLFEIAETLEAALSKHPLPST